MDHARFAATARDRENVRDAPLPGMPPEFLPPSARVVGTVGRLAAVKDQATLIRALAHTLEVRPEYRACLRGILVGDGPERPALEQMIAASGLQELVWLAGDREDIPALLARMDIFVLPSLGEGISNTVLEAMAAALPVVATRVGGNPELVADGESGELVPVGDVHALATALMALLDDPERAVRQGSGGPGAGDARL